MKNNLKKTFFWNTLGSGASSVISLLYLIIVTRINGTNYAGIFALSFATACMLYTISLYCGRTYQVTELNKKITDNDYLFHRLLCSIITIIIAVIFSIVNHYSGLKLILLIMLSISKVIESVSDVYHGFLQKNDKLDIVGKSLLLRSLLCIVLFLALDYYTNNLIYSCLSIVIINLLVLIFIDFRIGNKYKEKMKYSVNSIKNIFILGFFTFSVSFITNYLYNIPRYGIDRILNDNLQAIYGIIVMPATIIMLVNQFIIQPFIIVLKDSYIRGNKKDFLKCVYKIILYTIICGIITILCAYLFGVQILKIMYGIDLSNYKISLIIILIGAIFYTISSVFSNSLIVLRKTRIQFFIYLFTSGISYFVANILINNFKFNGAIYSYLIMMVILFSLYIISFILNIKVIDFGGEINEGKNK